MFLWIAVFLVVVGLSVYVAQIIALRRKLNETYSSDFLPPVSIIKPLKALDDNLFDNLESFCNQDYPEYEVILSLQDYNDPAYRVAEKIRNKYPHMVKIVIDNSSIALNPKVKNMISSYYASRYEYFLISDSNVMVDKDYLRKTVSAMTPDVGLVTNLITGVGEKSVGATLENLQLNSFIILGVSFLDKFLRMPCSIGKSMLMRKRDFEEIGGWSAVKNVLAEDYIIGKLMHESGKRVVLCNYMVKNVNEYWTMGRFFNRHTRWAKIRWKIAGPKYFTEPLSNPLFLSLAIPAIDGFSSLSLSFLSILTGLKIAMDIYIGRLLKTPLGLSSILIPVKDLFVGLIWFIPFFNCKINWRDNLYTIGKNTVITPYEGNSSLRFIYNKLKSAITG